MSRAVALHSVNHFLRGCPFPLTVPGNPDANVRVFFTSPPKPAGNQSTRRFRNRRRMTLRKRSRLVDKLFPQYCWFGQHLRHTQHETAYRQSSHPRSPRRMYTGTNQWHAAIVTPPFPGATRPGTATRRDPLAPPPRSPPRGWPAHVRLFAARHFDDNRSR